MTIRNRPWPPHFAEDDRKDGTFHAGVLTALDGMAVYPKVHWLTKEAGFFNDDGLWEPAGYIGFDDSPSGIDPFAQLVLTMKEASAGAVSKPFVTMRRSTGDKLERRCRTGRAVDQPFRSVWRCSCPVVKGCWRWPVSSTPGMALIRPSTAQHRVIERAGVTRTVFGLLNALPLAGAGAALRGEAAEAGAIAEESARTWRSAEGGGCQADAGSGRCPDSPDHRPDTADPRGTSARNRPVGGVIQR